MELTRVFLMPSYIFKKIGKTIIKIDEKGDS